MRNLAELVALLGIGEGVVGLVAPRRHMLLWKFGPEGYRRMMEGFAERPGLVRALAAAELGGGLWIALRQYGGPAR
ncbi:hypothetical protein [Rubrobacter aplysinae]|uniref:hypothetical protein n=1 Tax=Rubrobacter aplysinae TaxID=909625 RepID=UPI00064BB6A8|nr:hypothetical protein [Rubrobacter aplysinae]